MRSLVIKCTSGTDDLERCHQAFNVAATAASSGVAVSLWLTGDASWIGTPDYAENVELPFAAPLAELRDLVLANGSITVCTQCAKRRDIEASDLLPGVAIGGATQFVEESLRDGAQALIY
ncbi:MAG: DsrE family protein [Marmoricola sp.]